MLARVRRGVWGISRRLIASYVVVAVAAVVLIEGFVLGYQVPRLLSGAQLAAEVRGTAVSYWAQLSQQYPGGVPTGALLGERGERADPGVVRTTPNGSVLVVPAIPGALESPKAVTAVVALAEDGTIIASSAPSRYPAGGRIAGRLPVAVLRAVDAHKLKGVSGGTGTTPFGSVAWTLYGGALFSKGFPTAGDFTYVYVQAPQTNGYVDPVAVWDELGRLSGRTPFSTLSYALLISIVPIVALLGLLASRRLVGRVRRLERATVAVASGDYTVVLPTSAGGDRDEVGRLETNFTSITQQLRSAVAAERARATAEARAAERARIAREIHDAISQHLFALRMVVSGMRRADPGNEQVRAIEHITEEALRDMQALLWELGPGDGVDLDGVDRVDRVAGTGLAPALQKVCDAYRDRLGVTVDATLAEVEVPERVEHALLRVTQEACTNAVRHGNARRLGVSMTRRNGTVELAVRDDGSGFDVAAPTASAGSGLRHMRDRVNEVGGTVDIDSAPGAGTAVTVRVPVAPTP